jgi:hypothetical protein
MVEDLIHSTNSPRLKRLPWLPSEVPWLLGLGLVFYLLRIIQWNEIWEGFVYNTAFTSYLPWVFFTAALYAGLSAIPTWQPTYRIQIRAQLLIELLLSLGAVLYIKFVNPIQYVDDAGFILRYFDHFAEGCFFCFNVEDGPVFGLSSFVYGLLGGALTWSGLLNAEGAINYLTYAGVFCSAFLLFQILRHLIRSQGIVILTWVLLLTCSRSVAIIFNSGMEAPFHLSLVLTAILFFLQKRDKLMWLFMAISVISKLDAVPIVVVMAAFWTVENWKDLRAFDWYKQRYHDALRFGLVPVLVWIVFAWVVFGSPLPQSAFAKLYMHNHAKGTWFPFLEPFFSDAYRGVLFSLSMALFLAQLGWVAAKKKGGRSLVFGFGLVATLIMYYFYNPGERMVWYYVLPEALMLLQLAVSLQWFWGWLPGNRKWAAVGLTLGLAFMFTWSFTLGEMDYAAKNRTVVEGERIRIGTYLTERVAENETLQSGHGLISRKVKGYVVDETGLNFRVDTTKQHRNKALWEKYKPDWVVMHGFSWEVDKLNEFPYLLDTSFFDITTYGYPAWRIFRRTADIESSAGTYFINLDRIIADDPIVFEESQHFTHIKAKAFSFKLDQYNPSDWKITLGLIRHDYPYFVHIRDVFPGDTTVWQHTYVVDSFAGLGTTRIQPITIPLLRKGIPNDLIQGTRYIFLEFENSYGPVGMYDPAISVLRKEPVLD